MNHDEIIESATKTMHAEVCCPCDPQGCDWEHTPEARYARVLADAGLLARPLPSYGEIVDACRNGMNAGGPFPWPAADAVLELLKGQTND